MGSKGLKFDEYMKLSVWTAPVWGCYVTAREVAVVPVGVV